MVCPLLVQKQDFFVLHNLFFIALHFLGPKTGNKTFGVLSLPISSTLQGQEERNYCKYTTLSSLKGGTKMWNKCNLRRTANLLCFWNFCLITSLPEYTCLNGMVQCLLSLISCNPSNSTCNATPVSQKPILFLHFHQRWFLSKPVQKQA